MVSIPMSQGLVTIKFPTREEMREMMTSPAVAVTAIICATILLVGALAGVVYLATTGHDSAVIGVLLIGVIGAMGQLLNSRIKGVKTTIDEVKAQQVKTDA